MSYHSFAGLIGKFKLNPKLWEYVPNHRGVGYEMSHLKKKYFVNGEEHVQKVYENGDRTVVKPNGEQITLFSDGSIGKSGGAFWEKGPDGKYVWKY